MRTAQRLPATACARCGREPSRYTAPGELSLSEVLCSLWLDHGRTVRSTRLGLGSHDVWDRETGEVVFVGSARACWQWLRETGRAVPSVSRRAAA